jgi:hypothetical protein
MTAMQKPLSLICTIFLSGSIAGPSAEAQSWLAEGAREIEELRLQQLRTVQSSGEIAPFSSDGCSGYQSQNWELLAEALPGFKQRFGDKPPWENCCVAHDKIYWRGSVEDGYTKRKQADQTLRQCVADTGSEMAEQLSQKFASPEENVRHAFSMTAELMYKAVRLGGQPCSLLPWRWGYGWDNCAFAKTSQIPVHYSDVKVDEHITFFNTAAWFDKDSLKWRVPIHAWVYEPQISQVRIGLLATALEAKYGLTPSVETEGNFRRRSNLIIADNERGKNVVIRIAGKDVALSASAENGHVFTILELPPEVVDAFSDQGRLHFFAVTQSGDNRRFEGDVQLVSGRGFSVISDIDDTIKISVVTDHSKLMDNTFFKDFREVAGMPALFQTLDAHDVSIHFVSSSPWQLYTPLQQFTRNAGFPAGTMSLKSLRFRDETFFNLFKKGTETKPKQIEAILQRYPGRRFILIGDSGEQDPEVYGDIARRYPAQIERILIRNVDDSAIQDSRYQEAFENLSSSKWQLFDRPSEIVIDELLRN